MCVQDVLQFVIVRSFSRPSIKLSESNQIYPALLNIGQKPNKSRAFFVCLMGREAFVRIDPGYNMAMIPRPTFQGLALIEDGLAGSGLLVGAGLNPAVKCNFHAGTTPPFETRA